MAVLTVDGIPVAAGVVHRPLTGRATASIEVHAVEPLFYEGQRVTLSWFTGRTQKMSVNGHSLIGGVLQVELVAGKELDHIVRELYYYHVTVGHVARAIITEAGGEYAEVDAPELLPRYVRYRNPAHVALRHLLYRRGIVWQVLDDGRVWVGRPRLQKRGPYRVQALERSEAVIELAPDVQPGDAMDAYVNGSIKTLGMVTHVTHYISGSANELRTVVHVRPAEKGAA